MTGWKLGLMLGAIFHPFACMAIEWWHIQIDGADDAN